MILRRAWSVSAIVWIIGLSVGALSSILGCDRASPHQEAILVAAAASLRKVLPEIVKTYGASHGLKVEATYGASGDLKRQVEAGAPIDLVAFASGAPVDDLVRAGRVDPASRRVIATNELVLIGPIGGRALTFATLGDVPAGERIAIGDPGAVPAGAYARDALTRLGVWEGVRDRLVLGGDVGAVLAYVRRGEVAAGIVYRTEAQGIADVTVLETARGAWAPRPEVVVGVVVGSRGESSARAFLTYLEGDDARAILRAHGFGDP